MPTHVRPDPPPHPGAVPLSLFERHLAEHMVGVLAELRRVDADALAELVLAQSHSNIEDLIVSSAELFFRARAVAYAWSCALEIAWGRTPVMHFDLEFQRDGVFLAFRASLGTFDAGVSVRALMFDTEHAVGGPAQVDRFVRALKAARRPTAVA